MEINLDIYIRNLRIFYQQLIKGHKKEEQLSTGFKALVQAQGRKWNKVFGSKGQPGQRRVLSRIKVGTTGVPKLSIDTVFTSEKIEDIIAFGYCYLMMEYKNTSAFAFLSDGLSEIIKKNVFNQITVRRIKYFWDKIGQVISGKRKIARFQKLLQDGFTELQANLLEVIYLIIIKDKQMTKINIPKYLQQLTSSLMIRIDFFSVGEDKKIISYTFGSDHSVAMRFGFFKNEKIYGYVNKLPQKQIPQLKNDLTFQKFAMISQNLNKMYSTSFRQYLNLNNLKTKSKLERGISIVSTNNTTTQPITYSQQKQSSFQYI